MNKKIRDPRALSRRSFISTSASLAAATMLGSKAVAAAGSETGSLFSLGVASGDPASDGFVLWTRLARHPGEPAGGMPPEPIQTTWQVASDEAMTRIVREGTAVADPAWAHSVHIEVDRLQPDRWYWYRFQTRNETSPIGRTRTLPSADMRTERLSFAFASCQKYEMGYYTAYEHMGREDLDLVVFLGDYIYEKDDSSSAVRPHGLAAVKTLEDYRMRYGVYKSDASLQKAHAMAPWIVTWDDHEVGNDYAGAVPEDPENLTTADFLRRRAAAYQAYYEHMPLRRSARPSGPDLRLYRRLDYGRLARFHVLDTRQYRTDQPGETRRQPPSSSLEDPERTMLGSAQREWLADGLDRSPATWNVIAQQVLMAKVDIEPGPSVIVDVDKWAGYEHERRWLLRHLRDRRISNPVILTGDIHSNWANELNDGFDSSEPRSVAVEFVGTSISSGGHGVDQPDELATLLAQNPAVKFHNDERGYVRCEVTPESWRTDFRTVSYIDRPGAPLNTRASFEIEAGNSRLRSLKAG
ncbi:MAG: alkaline phosphatase D family protein [Opitutaceae bacterium]